MKQCPLCDSTFSSKVDFCFEDGSQLVDREAVSADPTSLPTALPTEAPRPVVAAQVAQSTDITEIKPRRSRSGMFRRPSLADMLSVPDSGVVPPVGGVRVANPAEPQAVVRTPAGASPSHSSLIVDTDADTLIEERDDIMATVLNEPDEVVDTGLGKSEENISFVPPAIQVPVSSIAVDVPDPSAVPGVEPTDAPPGFEKPKRSLDDSWFGDEDEFGLPEDTQPMAEGFIEDPGFADVIEPGAADDFPWADDPLERPAFPKGLLLGVAGLIAAVVLVFFLMPGEKPTPVAPPAATVAQVQVPPPPMSPPPPESEELAPEEVDGSGLEEAAGTAEGSQKVERVPPVPATAPPEARQGTPVKAKAEPVKPAVKPKVAAAKTSKSRKKPQTSDSPWGTQAAKPVAATPASNPWGAPEVAKRGRMNITSNVKARVFLDGKNIGNTPTSTEADFGAHTVRAEVKGYQSQSKKVNVQSGEIKVPFTLEAVVASGRCNLLGTPGDKVAMDGRDIGKLPQIVDCAPGKHSFKVTPGNGGAPYTKSMGSAGDFTTIMLRP